MFIEMLTAKNEKVSVNVNKVLFFAETKKGTTVILDDGTAIDLMIDYATACRRFNLHVDNAKSLLNSNEN